MSAPTVGVSTQIGSDAGGGRAEGPVGAASAGSSPTPAPPPSTTATTSPSVEASPGTRLSEPMIDRVRNRMASAPTRLSGPEIIAALRAEGCLLADRDLVNAAEQVRSELTGAGVLEPLLNDPEVTDVVVNAPDRVWVERRGRLTRTPVTFPDEASVRRLAQRLAAQAGRRLDDAAPCVDAVLPNGARLHAVLPPIAGTGTLISLRVPPRRIYTLDRLVASGMVGPDGARLLAALVASRVSFLIGGGTGTGKTTLLGALLSLVPSSERIVLAEECAEVVCRHPHLVRLQGRSANQEGVGDVGLRTLVRQALRMRPDRVVVGEVRGAEVCDLLAAMNTGHDGGCATVHANGVEEIPARIEALALSSGIDRASVHAQFAAGVRVVVHLARDPEGVRRLAGVGVVARDRDGWARVVPALAFGPDGRFVRGPGATRLGELLRVRGAVVTSEENARSAVEIGAGTMTNPVTEKTATASSGIHGAHFPVDSRGGEANTAPAIDGSKFRRPIETLVQRQETESVPDAVTENAATASCGIQDAHFLRETPVRREDTSTGRLGGVVA